MHATLTMFTSNGVAWPCIGQRSLKLSNTAKYQKRVLIEMIWVQSAFQFKCQDCPRSQMQPFGVGNTAGFEMWISAAQYSSSERI